MSLNKEYEYFNTNRGLLVKKYRGKFIVIKNQNVIGAYGSEEDAYSTTVKEHSLGTFLIQKCLPEAEIPPQIFHSRVII